MRIALVSTVSAVVGPEASGSIESWTWLLARELQRLGHKTTVFGCGAAQVPDEFVSTVPGPYGHAGAFDDWHLAEWVNLCRAVENSDRFDVIHSQAYLWGIPLERLTKTPFVHTLHIMPDDNTALLWRGSPQSRVTALSRAQWAEHPDLRPAALVPHGVDVDQFPLQEQPGDYLLYLGRFISGKGPLHAIQLARRLGIKLVLAGPENPYFREKIRPLVDGRTVEFAGFVRGAERSRLLGGARALLYPLQYAEPFGLVLVEAMLCGTPIAALRVGAIPEIMAEGVSGFTATNLDELERIVPRCFNLHRPSIRQHALAHFSGERMARSYVAIYLQAVAESSAADAAQS
jgi:glycosyltransferase involved in cell wall biosynthesis